MSSTGRKNAPLFNTPLESGIRSLFILESVAPHRCDLNRLAIFDYAIVHSADFPNAPPSVHPATPLRRSELLVRRQRVQDGLMLMIRKGLVSKEFSSYGVAYAASKLTGPFLQYLSSEYAIQLRDTATWIAEKLQPLSDAELEDLIRDRLGTWGTDFENSLLDEEADA